MSLQQNQTQVIGGTQIIINALGASVFPTKFQTGPNTHGGILQLISGATTFIMPNTIAGASMAGATVVVSGYPVSTTPFEWNGPANFFVGTASATAVISAAIFYEAGATLV